MNRSPKEIAIERVWILLALMAAVLGFLFVLAGVLPPIVVAIDAPITVAGIGLFGIAGWMLWISRVRGRSPSPKKVGA